MALIRLFIFSALAINNQKDIVTNLFVCLVYEVYRTERLKPLIQALDQYQINLFELPRPIQRVLMDLDYNPGSSLYRGKGQQSGWHKALTALKNKDYETFLDEITRKVLGIKEIMRL